MATSSKSATKKKASSKKASKRPVKKSASNKKAPGKKKVAASKKSAVKKPAVKKVQSKKQPSKKATSTKKAGKKAISKTKSIKRPKIRVEKIKAREIKPVVSSKADLNEQTAKSNDYSEMIKGNSEMPDQRITNNDERGEEMVTMPRSIPAPQEKYSRPADPYHGNTAPVKGKRTIAPSGKKPLWNK